MRNALTSHLRSPTTSCGQFRAGLKIPSLHTGLRTPLRTFVQERILLHLHYWFTNKTSIRSDKIILLHQSTEVFFCDTCGKPGRTRVARQKARIQGKGVYNATFTCAYRSEVNVELILSPFTTSGQETERKQPRSLHGQPELK